MIATNNQGKLREMQQIMTDLPLEVLSYRELIDHEIDVVEDGETFEANALKKAMAYPDFDGTVVLADDSGLEVDCLEGRPGIYSARYAGVGASKQEMCLKILGEVDDAVGRGAQFVSVMAMRFPDGSCETVKAIVRGTISDSMRGDGGFGYDPIFVPDGYQQTFSEMPTDLKNQLSHRRGALEQVRQVLQARLALE